MEILNYKKGDEVQILELFELAFKKRLSEKFWDWRFKNNPFGEDLMINLMWEGDILAGHYAVSAIELEIEGATVKSSLSGTTMTHPDFQGRGIFSDLASTLYERIHNQQDIALVYGFPNNNSHYGLVKNIHWQDVGIVSNFSRNFKVNFNKEELSGNGLNSINKFTKEHENFVRSNIDNLGFNTAVKRSEKYLNWRYLNCPINDYYCKEIRSKDKLIGIFIFKVFEADGASTQIDIMEFFCSPGLYLINKILDLLKNCLAQKGFKEIACNMWLSLFDPRHLLFEKLGFVISTPLTYMCAKPLSEEYAGIANFRNWYISMGDSDVY